MEVYKRPMSVRYIPSIFWAFVSVISLSFAFPAMAHAPWFDANGLNDVPAIQASTAVQKLQEVK
jgi:hypothetical protein